MNGGAVVKYLSVNAGDARDKVPGLERSPGVGNGHSLQYSHLQNSKNRGTWQAIVHGTVKNLA